jgi:D-alanine transaminase
MRLHANQASVVDAVMVRDGLLTEATASNVFVVHKGVISTPPKSDCLLPGITRDLVIELALVNGFEVQERDIKATELETADEIWLTSSTREIAPVVKINSQVIGNGVAGPVWRKIITIYRDYKQGLRNG